MDLLILDLIILAGFIGMLLVEKAILGRGRRRVSLVICVTGTRGKSTVTRQIASALRASGRRVLSKTTGSKPMLIFPDGSEREIIRPGLPSVLEQKRVLALASRLKADTLVAEMMSIGPECLAVESGKILQPDYLVVTNVRLDHEEEMGGTVEAVAGAMAAAVSRRSVVLIPEDEAHPAFDRAAAAGGCRIVRLASDGEQDPLPGFDYPDNVRLSLAAALHLGLDRDTSLKGIASARPDFGGLKIWSLISPVSGLTWEFAGLFAANEPESTRMALVRVRERLPFSGKTSIVLLNLRADRASRTRRWLSALETGFFSGFDRVIFIGEQASALGRRRIRRKEGGPEIGAIPGRTSGRVMSSLWTMSGGETVVVGVGNIAGIGRELVEFWSDRGTIVAC